MPVGLFLPGPGPYNAHNPERGSANRPAYDAQVIATGPSRYYRMDDPDGFMRDYSGSGGLGVHQGTWTPGVPGATQDGNTALTYDGTTGWSRDLSYVPFVASSTRTYSGWAKRDAADSSGALFGGHDSATAPSLTFFLGTQILIWTPTGGGPAVTWSVPTVFGTWFRWTLVVVAGTSAELRINGITYGTQAIATNYHAAPGIFSVGAVSEPEGNFFKGSVDEITVYERALTLAEDQQLWMAGSGQGLAQTVELQQSDGLSAATLALTAPSGAANVPLDPAVAQSAATLALTAPTQVPLGTAAAQSAATLALRAQTTVPLATAACQSAATLSLAAPTRVVLGTAAATATPTLALSAPTQVPLGTAAAVSSATLSVTIPSAAVEVPLATAACQSAATLALSAPTQVPLQTTAATSSATLALAAPTRVVLGTAAATASPTLALTAPTRVVLGTAAADLGGDACSQRADQGRPRYLRGSERSHALPHGPGPGHSWYLGCDLERDVGAHRRHSGSAADQRRGLLGDAGADGRGAPVPLGSAAAISSATLALRALTQIPLAASAAQSSATLALRAATRVVLQTSAGVSTATLLVSRPQRVTLGSAVATSTAFLTVVILDPVPETHPNLGGDVDEVRTGGDIVAPDLTPLGLYPSFYPSPTTYPASSTPLDALPLGGDVQEVRTGGTPISHQTSGTYDTVLTGGVYDEVLTGGEPDDTTGGDPNQVLTGGVVNEVRTGGVVNEVRTGGTFDEVLTGGDVNEVPTGDSPDESERGGTYDLVLTGGEVL